MGKFRILVVDDEDDVRTVVRLALSEKYEVVEAHDGLDALEQLERAEPDFVILDVAMPLMNGFEACRAIRKHPKFHDVPVLFLSAHRTPEEIKEGYGAGANLYLMKPFEPERLVKNVDYYLEQIPAGPRPKHYSIEQLALFVAKEGPAPPLAPREAGAPTPPAAKVEGTEPAEAAAAGPAEAAPSLRPRVIVVDDDTDLLKFLTVVLEKEFEITTAQNGVEAVEKVVLYQPDLIVLDAMLPKMSGYQLCSSLRHNQNFAATPIVFISAKSTPRDQEYCRRLGANDFIPKPFDPLALKERLLAYTAKSDFAVRPKKMTFEQIEVREKSTRWTDDRSRRAEARRRAPELREFIDREMT
jgi:DNA-binding response OmpR family regulator